MPTLRRRRPLGWLGMLAIAGCACLAVLALAALAIGTPARAAERLGPPAPGLDSIQASLLAVYLLANEQALDQAISAPGSLIEVEVAQGETADEVIARLQRQGIVADATLLRSYLRYLGLDRGIDAGRYQLRGEMTLRELAATLQTAFPPAITLVIPEGWRAEQIAIAVATSPLQIPEAEFLAALRTRPPGYSFSAELPEPPSLEGFLFPDTYFLAPGTDAVTLILEMLENFERRVTGDLRSGFSVHGLSLRQAVTLASIVEREAIQADERPLIASVFFNRLAIGMKLDADPTVQYAVGLQADGSWWKRALTLSDLAFDSPYNTYLYPGLPPGPIANPGLASLAAVAFPQDSPYLYFRALCDGSGRHAFALTMEDHLANACP
jgi:UPF0755 protein